jgi:hypothetical protein
MKRNHTGDTVSVKSRKVCNQVHKRQVTVSFGTYLRPYTLDSRCSSESFPLKMLVLILLQVLRGGNKAAEITHSAHISIHSSISECMEL